MNDIKKKMYKIQSIFLPLFIGLKILTFISRTQVERIGFSYPIPNFLCKPT